MLRTRREILEMAGLLAGLNKLKAAVKPVKVSGIDLFRIDIPVSPAEDKAGIEHRFNVVKIATDAGVTGYSFAGPAPNALDRLKTILLGKDLFNIEELLRAGLMRDGSVEHAVWDAIGKIAGQPAYKLLSGRNDRMKAYVTCVWLGNADQSHVPPAEQVAQAVRLRKAGFNGMKIRIWRPDPMDDVEVCRQILAANGKDFHLMVDRTAQMPVSMAGQKVWDFETGLRVARALQEIGVYWLEEPFHRDDFDGPARLNRMVKILITGGEGYSTLDAYRECLVRGSYNILQPDPRQAGGILMCKKVATLAEAFHVTAIPHGYMGLTLAGWMQAGLAMNSPWQEITMVRPPLVPEEQWAPGLKVLGSKQMYRFENGEILAPPYAGIGLDIDEDALNRYRTPA